MSAIERVEASYLHQQTGHDGKSFLVQVDEKDLRTILALARQCEGVRSELMLLRAAMEQSGWHEIPGGQAKRILVAKTAIKRIDAALAALPEEVGKDKALELRRAMIEGVHE